MTLSPDFRWVLRIWQTLLQRSRNLYTKRKRLQKNSFGMQFQMISSLLKTRRFRKCSLMKHQNTEMMMTMSISWSQKHTILTQMRSRNIQTHVTTEDQSEVFVMVEHPLSVRMLDREWEPLQLLMEEMHLNHQPKEAVRHIMLIRMVQQPYLRPLQNFQQRRSQVESY